VGLFLLRLRRKKRTKASGKPSHRQRRRGGRPEAVKCDKHSWFLTERQDPRATSYFPKQLNTNTRLVSYRVRYSTRWIHNYNENCKMEIGLPYINNWGGMSPTNVAIWRCHPLQAIASITSTVYSRLLKIMIKRHNPRFAFKLSTEILKVAAMYTITKDKFVLDRFLGIYRKVHSSGPIQRILTKLVRRLDVDQRFVYSQVCSQTHWLTHRSERPCDKSLKNNIEVWKATNSFLMEEDGSCPCDDFSCPYGSLFTSEFPRIKRFRYQPEPTFQRKLRVGRDAIGKPVRLTKRLRKPMGFDP